MATTPPSTGITGLDQYLWYVNQTLMELVEESKPEDGWKLTDLESPVSEVIGDKRDLIDIVSKWDDSTISLDGWQSLTDQQSQAISELKTSVEKIISSSETFESTMMWWDANYRTIFDVKEHTEVIHGDMESINASEANVTQMKQDVTTLRDQVVVDRDAALAARSGAGTARDAAVVAQGKAELAEDAAKTSEDAAKASEASASDRADAAKTYMDTAWKHRVDAIAAKNDAVTAKDLSEAARDTATTKADQATTEADRSETEADRAEAAAELADGTATRAVTARVDALLSGAPEAYDTLQEIADKLASQGGVDAALIQKISTKADKTALTEGLDTKADVGHEHSVSEVTGLQEELAGKVPSNSTVNQIYGTDGSGAQTSYPLGGVSAAANSIAYRTTGGALPVGTPTEDDHATTKAYVDAVKSTADAALPASKIQVVAALPESPVAGTIYLVTGA